MKMQSRSPLWPYLGILLSLFVFSLIAPKAWQRMQLAKSTITVEHDAAEVDRFLDTMDADAASRMITRRSDFDIQWSAEATTASDCPGPFAEMDLEFGEESAAMGLQSSISPPPSVAADTQEAIKGEEEDRLPELVLDPNVGTIELTSSLPTLADPAQEFNSKQNSKPVIELPPLDLTPLRNQLLTEATSAKQTVEQSMASANELLQHVIAWNDKHFWKPLTTARTTQKAIALEGPSLEQNNITPEHENYNAQTIPEQHGPSNRFAMRNNRRLFGNRRHLPSESQSLVQPGFLEGQAFAKPVPLLDALENLEADQVAGEWATETRKQLIAIVETSMEDATLAKKIAALRKQIVADQILLKTATTEDQRTQLLLVHYGLLRRVDIYRAAVAMQQTRTKSEATRAAKRNMQASLKELEELMASSPQGAAWRKYLKLNEVSELVNGSKEIPSEMTEKERREFVRKIYGRLVAKELSESQREFLAAPPMLRYVEALGHWAEGGIDLKKMFAWIEKLETSNRPSLSRAVAISSRRLAWSNDEGSKQLAQAIDKHYRNANIRIAMTSEFINRLVPQPKIEATSLQDRIAGASVRGQSVTSTKLFIELIPSTYALQFDLHAKGLVDSETKATSGPATFYSDGRAAFHAKKRFLISRRGVGLGSAIADAEADSVLQGLETKYDGIPIIDSMVRSFALKGHKKSYYQALTETENKVATRAEQRLDTETNRRVAAAELRFEQRVLKPLEALALNPKTVDMLTTEKRLVIRCRLASNTQCSAFTPRPVAPSDSFVSIQLHDSALNNTVGQLRLEGRTFKLPKLFQMVAKKLGRPQPQLPDDMPRHTKIHFAPHDAVQTQFVDGKMKITLAITSVIHRRRAYRNFKVTVYYRPKVDGLHAEFVREGIVEIVGKRLRPGDLAALQGIFVKAFDKNRPIPIIPAIQGEDPRLKGMMISQLILDDGWFGLAIGKKGPARVARLRR